MAYRGSWPFPSTPFCAARRRSRPIDALRGGAGALLGLLFAGLLGRLSRSAATDWLHPLLVAPIGASAVLVFAVPASPLAQPRSVLGGNIVSALVGITVAMLVPQTLIAAPLAVGLAIGTMMLLGCLHPPGGAVALITRDRRAGGDQGRLSVRAQSGGRGLGLLTGAGMIWGRLTGHSYPHRVPPPRQPAPHPGPGPGRPHRLQQRRPRRPWPATASCWTSAARTWTPCSARSSCRPPSGCTPRSAAAT
jgi:CBS domain-containing membrane protein